MVDPFELHSYSHFTIGTLAIITGAVGLTALPFALLHFSLGRSFWRLDDALVGLTALLSAGLAMVLFPDQRPLDPQLALIAFGLAIAGGFVAAFGAVLSITESASSFLAQLYISAGFALLGGWLFVLNWLAGPADAFPNGIITVGLFTGAVMALGAAALPGIVMHADDERTAPGISRYIAGAGSLGWSLVFPLWCIWLGRWMLSSG